MSTQAADGFGRTTARGVAWAFAAAVAGRVISFVSLAVLARLLAPKDFGLLGVALAFITYAETIGDLGTGSALVYWPGRREDAARVTFWANASMGVFWCALTWLGAPLVVRFFHAPDSLPLLRLLAFGFIVKFLGNTHDALLRRDMRFRARVVPEVGMAVLKAGVSITLALMGAGPTALAWGQLAGLGAWTIALWILVPWRPSTQVPWDLVKPMLGYGRGIVAVNVMAAVVHHADLVVVGRMIGASALGLYQVATKIPEASVSILTWAVSRVVFPAFSRARARGASLREPYLSTLAQVTLLTLPLTAVIGVLARPLVITVLGAAWTDAAPILAGLAMHAAVRSVGTHAGDVMKATGRSNLLAALAVGRSILLVPILILAARFGPAAVAWALAGATGIGSIVNLATACRLESIPGRDVLRALAPGVAVACAGLVVGLAWMQLAPSLPAPISLVAGGALVGATMLGVSRIVAPGALASLVALLRPPREAP